MKKIILLFLILIVIGNLIWLYPKLFGNVLFNVENEETEIGFVTKVIDGDTIVVNGESVRLLSIDTAEKGEKCFKEAKERLEQLILNKEVILEKEEKDKDQYKRLLRHIFIEETNGEVYVNLLLVKEGLAIARFYEDKKYKEEILEAEKTARGNKMGCKWRDDES